MLILSSLRSCNYVLPKSSRSYSFDGIYCKYASRNFKDMAHAFPLFYYIYRAPLDFPIALQELNGAIDFTGLLPDGRKKTEFFVYLTIYIRCSNESG